MNIFLIGMMGSGKSTVGRLVAEKLKCKFYDSDELIEQEEKMAIAALFKERGEKAFRSLEKKIIHQLSMKKGIVPKGTAPFLRKIQEATKSHSRPLGRRGAVIATGGGAPCFRENWDSFSRDGFVVWLRAAPSILYKRVRDQRGSGRPLLNGRSLTIRNISNLLAARDPFYQKADFVVESDTLTPEEAAAEIVRILKRKAGGG